MSQDWDPSPKIGFVRPFNPAEPGQQPSAADQNKVTDILKGLLANTASGARTVGIEIIAITGHDATRNLYTGTLVKNSNPVHVHNLVLGQPLFEESDDVSGQKEVYDPFNVINSSVEWVFAFYHPQSGYYIVIRCCNCTPCNTCLIAQDDFGRPYSTDPGAGWVEEYGDWWIDNEELTISDADAVILHADDNPHGIQANVVTVRFMGDADGDTLRILISVTDADNWLGVEIKLSTLGGDCGTMSIIESVAGVVDEIYTAIIPGLDAGEWHTIKVCYLYDGTGYTGKIGSFVTTADGYQRLISRYIYSPGTRVGLGTGSQVSTVHFDGFCWQRHRTVIAIDSHPPDTSCPDCRDIGCAIVSDDFDRSDGTDLECFWNEIDGDWEIDTGTLVTSDSDARIENWTRHPYYGADPFQPSRTVHVSVLARGEDEGDCLRVILGFGAFNPATQATLPFMAIELEVRNGCGVLRIWMHTILGDEVQVGGDIGVARAVPGEWHSISVCYGTATVEDVATDHALSVRVTPANGDPVSHTVFGNGASHGFVGLGTGAVTTKASFDDFVARQSYHATFSPGCPDCDLVGCAWGYLTCDGANFACDWEELSGSWNCATTSDSNAIIRFARPNPLGTTHHRVVGTFDGDASGSEALVYIAFKDSSTTHLAARFMIHGTCGTLELVQDGSQLAIRNLQGLTPGATHYFCIWYDGETLTAGVRTGIDPLENPLDLTPNRILQAAATADEDGLFVALGTGTNNGEITFSTAYLQTAHSESHVGCEPCEDCELLRDDFDRADGINLLCDWEHASGTMTHDATQAKLTGTGTYALQKLGRAGDAYVQAIMEGDTVGQTLRLYVNAAASASVGPWAEVKILGPGTATLRLSTGDTLAVSLSPGEQIGMRACHFGGVLRATLYHPSFGVWGNPSDSLSSTIAATGQACGIGTFGASGIAYFDNFYAGKKALIDGTVCDQCHAVCEACKNNIIPSQFMVEINGFDNLSSGNFGPVCCPVIDSVYFVDMDGLCSGDHKSTMELPCGTVTVFVRFRPPQPGGGFYNGIEVEVLHVSVDMNSNLSVVYRLPVTFPYNCQGISGLDIPFFREVQSDAHVCTGANSSCALTAV